MKKFMLFAGLSGVLFLFSCDKPNPRHINKNLEVAEEEITEEILNDSDVDFDIALDEFEAGETDAVIDYINYGIEDLRNESEDLSAEEKAKIEMSIASLKVLAEDIENGEINEIATLEEAFAMAEMNVAHTYITLSNFYILDKPKKAQYSLMTGIKKMENAASKLTGEAKDEAVKLIDEGGAFIKKGVAIEGKAIREYLDKFGAWLEKHQDEMKAESQN